MAPKAIPAWAPLDPGTRTSPSSYTSMAAGSLDDAERGPGEASSQTDPLDAKREERGGVQQGARQPGDDVEGRRNLGGQPPDRVRVVDARHEDAVRAGLDVPRRPVDCLG